MDVRRKPAMKRKIVLDLCLPFFFAFCTGIQAQDVSDVNLFEGVAQLSIPLAKISAGGGIDLTATIEYKGNVKNAFRDDNNKAPTHWLGLGWELSAAGYIMEYEGQSSGQSYDDLYILSLDGMDTRPIIMSGGNYYINGQPYTAIARNGDLWTVRLRDGTTYKFGEASQNAANVRSVENGGIVNRWYLSTIQDVTEYRRIEFTYNATNHCLERIRAKTGTTYRSEIAVTVGTKNANELGPDNPNVEKYFLNGLEINTGSGTLVKKFSFEYLNPPVVNGGGFQKRILKAVHLYNANDAEKPGYTFDYDENRYYVLDYYRDPMGYVKTFGYEDKELANSAKVSPEIVVNTFDDAKLVTSAKIAYCLGKFDAADPGHKVLKAYLHTGTAFRKILEVTGLSLDYTDLVVGPDYFVLWGAAGLMAQHWNGRSWDQSTIDSSTGVTQVSASRDYFLQIKDDGAAKLSYINDEGGITTQNINNLPAGMIIAMPSYFGVVSETDGGHTHSVTIYNYNSGDHSVVPDADINNAPELSSSDRYSIGAQGYIPHPLGFYPGPDFFILHRYNYEFQIVEYPDCQAPQWQDSGWCGAGCADNNKGFNTSTGVNDSVYQDVFIVYDKRGSGTFSKENIIPTLNQPGIVWYDNVPQSWWWGFPRPGNTWGDFVEPQGEYFCEMITPYHRPNIPLGLCWGDGCYVPSCTGNPQELYGYAVTGKDKFWLKHGDYSSYVYRNGASWEIGSWVTPVNIPEPLPSPEPDNSLIPNVSTYNIFSTYTEGTKLLIGGKVVSGVCKLQLFTFDGVDYGMTQSTTYPVVTSLETQAGPYAPVQTYHIDYSPSSSHLEEFNICSAS